jgi:hypothetical protein
VQYAADSWVLGLSAYRWTSARILCLAVKSIDKRLMLNVPSGSVFLTGQTLQ